MDGQRGMPPHAVDVITTVVPKLDQPAEGNYIGAREPSARLLSMQPQMINLRMQVNQWRDIAQNSAKNLTEFQTEF